MLKMANTVGDNKKDFFVVVIVVFKYINNKRKSSENIGLILDMKMVILQTGR